MPELIRLVCATREDERGFYEKCLLGRSLSLYKKHDFPFLQLRLFERNTRGLPAVYNQAIDEARDRPAVLVFVHDDIHLSDFFWTDRLLEGLKEFAIVGVAGNRRRLPKQPAWLFIDGHFTWDHHAYLSGSVAHGNPGRQTSLKVFGPPCQEVKLLDGLMLACRSQTLIDNDVRFDERFDFHFYDMDFCRSAEDRKVRMGTWSISVVHESGGAFSGPAWAAGYAKYLSKWKE